MNVTQALRAAIRKDGRSLNELGRAIRLDPGVLSRFVRGERDIVVGTADLIVAGLSVDVRLVRRRKAKDR